jgi:hypothetical protein
MKTNVVATLSTSKAAYTSTVDRSRYRIVWPDAAANANNSKRYLKGFLLFGSVGGQNFRSLPSA